jgi:hypothetical protein
MTDGWRRLPAIVLLMVFALIQGWAPLLHAHVGAGDTPSAESGVRGIHLPDRAVLTSHAHVPGEPSAGHAECQGDEGALVTAPIEHRRDDRLAATPAPAVTPPSHAPPEALSASSTVLWFLHPTPFAAKADAAPPFPAGPPGRC